MKTTIRTFSIVIALLLSTACGNNQQNEQTADSTTETTKKNDMETNYLSDFGEKYAKAWCSQQPDSVAAFFAEDGSLTINNATPAVGRAAIAKSAAGFMTAFPDMIVSMDSMPTTTKGTEFHWTLTGTNTGPNGTGKKIRISGVEIWKFNNDGLIKESMGSFDADEYNRQLKEGIK